MLLNLVFYDVCVAAVSLIHEYTRMAWSSLCVTLVNSLGDDTNRHRWLSMVELSHLYVNSGAERTRRDVTFPAILVLHVILS